MEATCVPIVVVAAMYDGATILNGNTAKVVVLGSPTSLMAVRLNFIINFTTGHHQTCLERTWDSLESGEQPVSRQLCDILSRRKAFTPGELR
jgi:hypothetical protein